MLVLTRKRGQTVVINNNIFVTVVKFGTSKVKLGVVAPPNVPVKRLSTKKKSIMSKDFSGNPNTD